MRRGPQSIAVWPIRESESTGNPLYLQPKAYGFCNPSDDATVEVDRQLKWFITVKLYMSGFPYAKI
jgi:hypothetical protein